MSDISEKKGKELLSAILEELKGIDLRIVPFDSDEIQTLEYGVVQGVRDVFGSESPEYSEFEGFRIAAGNISRGDSRTEKQAKYEMGLPRAVARLEELLHIIDQSEEHMRSLPPKGPREGKSPARKPAPKPASKPAPPKASAPSPEKEPREAQPAKPAIAKGPAPSPKSVVEKEPAQRKEVPAPHDQPGRILLLQEGGDEITSVVKTLLDKVGIKLVLLDGESPSELEDIMGLKNVAFTIMALSGGTRGGLSGLTSVIGKPSTRHESIFKLGLLVGSLGPGKVVILHSSERLQDIPENLFGVRYIPFKEEGGWQIGLLKLLKANGFFIDANLLFD